MSKRAGLDAAAGDFAGTLVPARRKGAHELANSLFRDREFKSRTGGMVKALKNDIVRGAYLPGAKLRISELAEFHGVSPGAVREALSRLVSEGLVEFNEQRGFRASPVSRTALMDVTNTRIVIEGEALRLSIKNGSKEWSRRVKDNHSLLARVPMFKRGSSVVDNDWALLHRQFHRGLLEACESEWLLRFADILFEQSERYRHISSLVEKKGLRTERDIIGEHRAIAKATIERDTGSAVARLTDHYLKTAATVARNSA
jgi:DNA-binding GntR family transcriptional regulator